MLGLEELRLQKEIIRDIDWEMTPETKRWLLEALESASDPLKEE